MSSKIVDTEELVQEMITTIMARPQPLVFLDLEGVDLSRHGLISIMQILSPPDSTVYLVDVHTLGEKSFSTSAAGNTLRSIMESKDVAKVFYDVRNDSDALFHQFGIKLCSVVDIQIIEFVGRPDRGQFVKGLAKCIGEEDICLPHDPDVWEAKKNRGRQLFVPELGGRYDVLLQRPISKEIVDYCESDVLMMPALLAIYGRRLDVGLGSQVQRLTNERINLAQRPSFKGKGRGMARGPDLTKLRSDARNTPFPMNLICSPDLEGLCHVDGLPEPQLRKLTRGLDAIRRLSAGGFFQDRNEPVLRLIAHRVDAMTGSIGETDGGHISDGHRPRDSHDTGDDEADRPELEKGGNESGVSRTKEKPEEGVHELENVRSAQNEQPDFHRGSSTGELPDVHEGGESSGSRPYLARDESVNFLFKGNDDMKEFIERLSSNNVDDTNDSDGFFEHFPDHDRDDTDSEESMKDLTACDKECGYCGHCMY